MRFLILSLAALVATEAHAEGFAVRDLSTIADDASTALGAGFIHRVAPERVTLFCSGCKGGPMIDILLGRQTDGTEQRVRSGQTSMTDLERLCQAKDPACSLTELNVSPAVGWLTTWPMGSHTGSTAVILRDGDLLTIRSIAADADTARSNAETLVKAVSAKVIGR
ncbi:hypothetical protein [Inquilinus limosus]|uniref:Uncharacterized protein n=1 Tax=Inquilinus limosus MP06 TaxID=1398085 RepID=A0A0A0D7A7_9PROT|nr:hypothetical protein [Inquilinus limosus]KGM34014.1 hypothetical protein P409_12615 [Inquilinus limosus MP06]